MNTDGPPLIFSFLGVIVGVGVAWLLTRDSAMAIVFLVAGVAAVAYFHLRRKRLKRK